MAVLSGVTRQHGKEIDHPEMYFADPVLKNMRTKHCKLKLGIGPAGR